MERKSKATMANPYPKLKPQPVPIPQPMPAEKPWPWSKPTAYASSANATVSSSVSFPPSRENFQKSHTQRVSSPNEPEPGKAWPSFSVLANTSESWLKPKPKVTFIDADMDADAELLFGYALASAYNKQSASGLRPEPASPYSASLARPSNEVIPDPVQNRLPMANHGTENKGKPPPLYPLPSTKTQTDSQPNGFKPCTKCHRLTVRADDARKQCEKCRAYGREATRRAKARQSERVRLSFGYGSDEDLDVPDAAEADGKDNKKAKEKARNASEVFGHVENKSKNRVTPSGTLEEMRKRLKTSLKEEQKQKQSSYSANSHPSSAVSASASDLNTSVDVADAEAEADFQTASEMYAQLRIARRTPRFEFRGRFSIVRVARVDDAARERLVVEELRKIAKLKFRHDKPFLIRSDMKQRLAFPCSCLTVQPATFGVGSSPSSTLAPALPFVECGGTVIVHAQEDQSNPYVAGQKITVCIKHQQLVSSMDEQKCIECL